MKLWGFIVFIALLASSAAASGRSLVLNTDDSYPLSSREGTGFEDLIIKEAFRRAGASAEIIHLPSERALVNADKGIDDGNFVRIEGLEKIYTNLIRVPEKINDFEFAVFTKDHSIRIEGWDSLRPYDVGIITGWKILEANVVGTRSLTKVNSVEALFALLANDRTDLVVYDLLQGDSFIKRHGLAGVSALKPLLAKRDMFLYLNRRHADLAPKLATALRSMKRDGSFHRIRTSVLGRRD